MKLWKVKFEGGVAAYFETYEALEVFLDAMIYTSKGEEQEYWENVEYETVMMNESNCED